MRYGVLALYTEYTESVDPRTCVNALVSRRLCLTDMKRPDSSITSELYEHGNARMSDMC